MKKAQLVCAATRSSCFSGKVASERMTQIRWLLLIPTRICFVAVLVENESDAARAACAPPSATGTGRSCTSRLGQRPRLGGGTMERWHGRGGGHNGPFSAAALEEARGCRRRRHHLFISGIQMDKLN